MWAVVNGSVWVLSIFLTLVMWSLILYYLFFLGKKVLDHSALLGLAAKLDFTTVKLRKTGIVEQVKYMHN